AGGAPGSLVAVSSEVTIAAGQAAGWVDFPLPSTVTLAAGNYWLGYWYGSNTAAQAYYTPPPAPAATHPPTTRRRRRRRAASEAAPRRPCRSRCTRRSAEPPARRPPSGPRRSTSAADAPRPDGRGAVRAAPRRCRPR